MSSDFQTTFNYLEFRIFVALYTFHMTDNIHNHNLGISRKTSSADFERNRFVLKIPICGVCKLSERRHGRNS